MQIQIFEPNIMSELVIITNETKKNLNARIWGKC